MRFQNLSIRYKLTFIMLFVSWGVLLIASGAFMINDLRILKQEMVRDLKTQTDILKDSILSAVQFEDKDFAKRVLIALRQKKDIVLVQVYRYKNYPQSLPHGYEQAIEEEFVKKIFTKQPIDLIESYKPYGLKSSVRFLQFSQPLYTNNQEFVGSIVLLLNRQILYQRIQEYIIISIIIVLASALLAFVLSTHLQKLITDPILALVDLTHRVSEEKNYQLRLPVNYQDEFGKLFQGFNEMLDAIQDRDNRLEQHREQLERMVAIRTAELKKLNIKLTHQAYHDALTSLPNRALFIKRAEQAVIQAEENDELLAMLFIDLDRFKYINDTLGHAAGDHLLQEVANRLLSCTRSPEDTVARLGGDEFTLLLCDIKESANASRVAEYIINTLTRPLTYNHQEFYITPSIGISIYPKDGRDVGSLMKNADAGMYMAKRQGRNNYRFYISSDNATSATRLNMENKLRQALEYNQFEVWYQPRYDIVNERIVGAEALVRWRSPDFNLVSPSQFIPLAEDTGLIIPIGEWVLRTACLENIQWQQANRPPIHISVNLSARQFVQEDLLSTVDILIRELEMSPQRLELELTESLIMPNADDSIETLRALKQFGIQISVDDFGTGYSSLSYLKRFPIDNLKIDQSFVRDIQTEGDDTTLIKAIIAMAHSLRLKVVAEGVETEAQLAFLKYHQCDYVQGFLFGKPMPAQQFRQLLDEQFPA